MLCSLSLVITQCLLQQLPVGQDDISNVEGGYGVTMGLMMNFCFAAAKLEKVVGS